MTAPKIDDLIDRAARIMATGMNGGCWMTHYTEAQRQKWRDRVVAMWRGWT